MFDSKRSTWGLGLNGLWATGAAATVFGYSNTGFHSGDIGGPLLSLIILFAAGAVFCSSSMPFAAYGINILFSICGISATGITLGQFFGGASCGLETLDQGARIGGIIGILIAEAIGIALAIVIGVISNPIGLLGRVAGAGTGLFALVDLALFFQAPTGLSFLHEEWAGIGFTYLVALALAFLLLVMPDVTVTGCSFALLATQISDTTSLSCAGPNADDLTNTLGAVVLYILIFLGVSFLARRVWSKWF